MDHRLLGRTGLQVSRLCLGTMNFGPQTESRRAVAIMDRGARPRHQLLRHGQRLRRPRPSHRADHRPLVRAGRRAAREGRAGHQGLRADERLAERRRGCRRCTSARRATPACGGCRPTTSTSTRCTTSTATRRGRRSGRRWSCSSRRARCSTSAARNFAGWHIVQANEAARRRDFLGLVSEQSLYNLNARTVELEVLPACRPTASAHPWSPLGGGLLGGALQKVTRAGAAPSGSQRLDRAAPRSARGWERCARELGEAPADVALAWLLHQPAVTAPIIGPRTAEQLDGACAPSRSSSSPTRSSSSTRSSPGRAAPPPRPTPGSRRHRHCSFASTRSPRSAGTRSDQGDDDQREPTPRSGEKADACYAGGALSYWMIELPALTNVDRPAARTPASVAPTAGSPLVPIPFN